MKRLDEEKIEEHKIVNEVDFDSDDQPILPSKFLDDYDYWDNIMEEACKKRHEKLNRGK